MTVGTQGDAPPHGGPFRAPTAWWVVPAGLAVVAAAALFLPWWRADTGPVLLGGGPLRALAPDSWSGYQAAGRRATIVLTLAVGVVAGAGVHAYRSDAWSPRTLAAAAGASAAACAVAAVVASGPGGTSAAAGVWVALAAGLTAVGAALAPRTGMGRTSRVLAAALLAATATAACPVSFSADTPIRSGPVVLVAPIGSSSVRTGTAGLPGTGDDARPVVVDGAPGVVAPAGVAVVDPQGGTRVLARTADHAPPPLGVAGGRVARWVTADRLAVTELRADGPLEVVVRDIGAASPVGDDGSIWLRSDLDPPETVRRLDLAAYAGRQDLSATYLPVVTIQNPDGEGPIDVPQVRPVPGGALRLAGPAPQLQLLTGTAAGVAVRPLPGCLAQNSPVAAVAADATGVWFPTGDGRLAHVDPDGTVRAVDAVLPTPVHALAAPGDGSVLLVVGSGDVTALWRLPDATAALGGPPAC